MIVHDLKCHPAPFEAMALGHKTFEFRKDDRGFKEGHLLRLREFVPEMDSGFENHYTGRELLVRVTYLLRGPAFGVPDGFVVMSVSPLIVTHTGAASSSP